MYVSRSRAACLYLKIIVQIIIGLPSQIKKKLYMNSWQTDHCSATFYLEFQVETLRF